ncbi:hypothetical protein AX15_005094 [Amanita polypyramis BW_CC]|nr:hypothetical protein AX15_005094 [Amanita polypyramis BW_CC]
MSNKFINADSYPLKFSTNAVPLQFELKDGLPFAPAKSQIKVFGLEPGDDFDTSIAELYKFAGFPGKPLLDATVTLIHPDDKKPDTLHRRNAVWYMPGDAYATVMRLNFRLSEMDKIKKFFQNFLGDKFTLTGGNIAVRKRTRYDAKKHIWDNTSEIIMDFTGSISGVEATITSVLSLNGRELMLIVDFNGANIDTIVKWLEDTFKIPRAPSIPDVINPENLSLSRISLLLNPNMKACFAASVMFQLTTSFGAAAGQKSSFFFTFSWPNTEFVASLFPGIEKDDYKFFYPEYEPYRAPAYANEGAGGLNLAYFTSDKALQRILPTITSAALIIQSDRISVWGELAWGGSSGGSSSLPVVKFDRINLLADYNIKSKNILAYLGVSLQLLSRRDLPPVDVAASISYTSGGSGKPGEWIFGFDLNDVYLSTLYSFFDEDVGEGVVDMLKNVKIDYLRMKYEYSASPSFTLSGLVLLGQYVSAGCDYNYKPGNWTLKIKLDSGGPDITIATIMRSILGDDVFLPDCVGNIQIISGGGKAPADILSITVSKKEEYLIFNAVFNLGTLLSFSFVQLRKIGSGDTSTTKRILKISVGKLSITGSTFVEEQLQKMINIIEMAFQWVDDKGNGLTRKEVDFLNKNVLSPDQQIIFKEPDQGASKGKEDSVVLQKGLHFLIALLENGKKNVILDHRFGSTEKEKSSELESISSNDDNKAAGSGDTSSAPMGKKFGPLSISNIGLQFVGGMLYIVLDATFELGPLELSLLGFRVGAKFTDIRKPPESVKVDIQGLSVGLQMPPITLAGLFRHKDDLYEGGIIIGFVPYSLTAVGFYGKMNNFTTVFVFAKLEGPLICLEFALISGVCGGFGYNNTIGYPTIDQVATYPFITQPKSSNPDEVLQSLLGKWVQPMEKVNWFVVGMKVRAFDMLDVDAVVVVTVTPSVKLGIFAVCQAGFPSEAPPDKRIIFVRLGIGAEVDFNAGTMVIYAQLAPDSYILAPSCHLTGGFGLFYWFGSNEHAGDWVFSIGGFHPSFMRPTYYPNPPRLGISWQVDSTLSIIGESYFAITPKCCMAGAHIHAALSLGPLGAWFDATTNMLINFKPFWFEGDVSVSVGVSFTLRLWICTIYIKVEIGAAVIIQGPPISGTAHVKFWVFGFDVHFGADDDKEPDPATFPEFLKMCLQAGSQQASLSASPLLTYQEPTLDAAPTEDPKYHVLAVSTGLLPTSPKSGPWDVRGSIFSFVVQSRFAIRKATVKSNAPDVSLDCEPFSAKPMHLTSVIDESTLTISITKDSLFAEYDALDKQDKWRITKVEKDVPDALWGKYNEKDDPMKSGNQISGLLDPKTGSVKIKLAMSITVLSPLPELAPDKIKKFNFLHAMAKDVFDGMKRPPFPDYKQVPDSFDPDAPITDKGKVTKEQWEKVQKAWGTDTAKTTSQEVFKAWSTAYKWNLKEPDLSPLPPKLAVKNFLNVYMSAPRMCV